MKRNLLPLIAAFLCFALLFSACGVAGTEVQSSPSASDASTPTESKDLVIASLEIPNALDPMKVNSASHLRRIGAAESLFKIDEKGQILPELAESTKQIDASTWEITLRFGEKFWSGKAVNADAVIASLEQSKAEDANALVFLNELTFSKIDDTTIQVKTARENMQVPLNLSCYQTVIHNADSTFESVETADLTGMYKVVDFKPEQSITLEINDNYWGQKPTINRVINNQVPDEQTRVLLAKSGDADIVLDIPVTSVSELKSNSAIRLTDAPSANPQTIYLNLKQPQLQDIKVRQALSWALDREELVLLGAEGQSSPVTTWLGANPAFSEAKTIVYGTTADLEKAASLLDEAGWKLGADGIRSKNGEQLTVRLMTWGAEKALGEAVQSQWTKLGINAEVQYVDYSVIEDARKSGDWDASIEAWSTFGDPYTVLKGQFSKEGGANYGGYDDEETNKLLEQLAAAADDDTRHKLALEVNERVAAEAPAIYLYPRPYTAAVSTSLDGVVDHFRQFEYLVTAELKFNS